MGLPIEWVEKIFQKLTLAYGRDFLDRWKGLPMDEVKRDWSDCLAGFAGHPDAIAYALQHLPDGKPPTTQEFRAICRKAPMPQALRLDAPAPSAEVVRAQFERLEAVKAQVVKAAPLARGKDWAHRIMARHETGERLSPFTVRSAQQALRVTGTTSRAWA